MSLSARLRRAPLRLVSGAYIVNSGVTKLGADDVTAKQLHGTASGAYPFVEKIQPKMLANGLGVAEIAVGGALLLPIVSPLVAGAALVGFSSAVLKMYWDAPGMHETDSPRPTERGVPLAKDVWLLGMGLGLMADAAFEPAHDKVVELEATVAQKRAEKSRRARRKAKKAARSANADQLKQLRANAMELQAEASKRAAKAAKKARKRAESAADVATAKLAGARTDMSPVAAASAERARSVRAAAIQAAQEYGPVAAEKARAARDAAVGLAEEYGPVAAEKARAARDAAVGLAEEYRPVAEKKAKRARKAAKAYAAKAQQAAAETRDRIAS
ncbi:MAG: hypothetical protein QOH89_2786 [Pseudonocardiales bacterium]|nr:hypothetical protein [Pseudonocardiales bacterium]